MASIVPFPEPGGTAPALRHVGGKGMSLWRMSTIEGIAVPNGFVLTMTFFEKWFQSLRAQPCWQTMLDACKGYDPDDQGRIQAVHAACEASKDASRALALDAEQRRGISAAIEAMAAGQGPVKLVAVRSSSPEEDLAGMSFAGGYETVLGVKTGVESILDAVQRVFASCLDERVFVYKVSHGIQDLTPRIAVVVQRQVAAQVAGVAFSLDPITNCYDWATINANFGLGETVVSGQCSPDYFLINKHTKAMLKKELGKKETSVWLGQDGGVREKPGDASQWTLSDDEVKAIAVQLCALERFYGHPVDTEFALDERRRLMWLQARPITTHVALPPQLVTEPGRPEVLWIDAMQVVQGFTELPSVTGLSFLRCLIQETIFPLVFGLQAKRATIRNRPAVVVPEAGLFYISASFVLRLVGWKEKDAFAKKVELMDFNVAKALRELEDQSFPKAADFKPMPLYFIWNNPGFLVNLLRSSGDLEAPARRAADVHAGAWGMWRDLFELKGWGDNCAAMGAFQKQERSANTRRGSCGDAIFPPTAELVAAHRKKSGVVMRAFQDCCGGAVSPAANRAEEHVLDLVEAVLPTFAKAMLYGLVCTAVSGGLADQGIRKMFDKAPQDVKAMTEDVTQGCGFVTTALSDLLEELAEALEETDKSYSLEELVDAAKRGGQGLPPRAREKWGLIIDQFGHRGVGELDLCMPRYREEPEMLLEQVIAFLAMEKSTRPKGLAAIAIQRRDAAVEKLSVWLGQNGGDVAEFKKQVSRYHAHFCYRESGKYLVIKLVEFVRLGVLEQAQGLLKEGRINDVEDVWLLTLHDLRRIHQDKSVDVRALIAEHRALRAKNAHVKSWPKLLTSRGRVIRPKPREAKEGEVAGHAISPGKVQGRIKVLSAPREKPLLKGEILVAKATDPGWTPLFVPAAGILLEVGGALQHGALVAREFGKPCVAGIENVTARFKDGQLVEMDGTEGIVKIIEEAAS